MVTQTPLQQLYALLPLLLPSEVVPWDERFVPPLAATDWVAVAEQANLAAAFFTALRARNVLSILTPAARTQLEYAYNANTVRQMILCALLARIVEVWAPLAVPPIVLKGLAYAYDVYPDPNARMIGDIDLLVAPEETAAATAQLLAHGFQHTHTPILLRHGLVYTFLRRIGLAAKHPQIMRRIRGSVQQRQTGFFTTIAGKAQLVEIHHGLINLLSDSCKGQIFRTQQEQAYASRTLFIEGQPVQVLDHASSLLHAVRHLALHHKFIGLHWHYDIALMLLKWREDLNPEQVFQQARRLASQKILRVEFALLEELFGPTLFSSDDRKCWLKNRLPIEYPVYRRVIRTNGHTVFKELVRPLLAPNVKDQLIALCSQYRVELSKL